MGAASIAPLIPFKPTSEKSKSEKSPGTLVDCGIREIDDSLGGGFIPGSSVALATRTTSANVVMGLFMDIITHDLNRDLSTPFITNGPHKWHLNFTPFGNYSVDDLHATPRGSRRWGISKSGYHLIEKKRQIDSLIRPSHKKEGTIPLFVMHCPKHPCAGQIDENFHEVARRFDYILWIDDLKYTHCPKEITIAELLKAEALECSWMRVPKPTNPVSGSSLTTVGRWPCFHIQRPICMWEEPCQTN